MKDSRRYGESGLLEAAAQRQFCTLLTLFLLKLFERFLDRLTAVFFAVARARLSAFEWPIGRLCGGQPFEPALHALALRQTLAEHGERRHQNGDTDQRRNCNR